VQWLMDVAHEIEDKAIAKAKDRGLNGLFDRAVEEPASL
jgi:hypothetical protein